MNLEDELAQLECPPDLDPGKIERVRNDLMEVNRQLADAQERLMVLENEYNFRQESGPGVETSVAHRHATGLVRAEAEALGLGWICERELREGQGGQPLHLPDGVVISQDDCGKQWRTAVEVELTRKTEARVVAILRHLLASYDDVVYRVHPSAQTLVTRSVAALKTGSERIMIRPYPPPTLAAVA